VGAGGGTGGAGAAGAGHLGEREDEGGEHVAHCGSGRHAMRRPNTLDDICKVVLTYANVCGRMLTYADVC
jgi:hypothetical protein